MSKKLFKITSKGKTQYFASKSEAKRVRIQQQKKADEWGSSDPIIQRGPDHYKGETS